LNAYHVSTVPSPQTDGRRVCKRAQTLAADEKMEPAMATTRRRCNKIRNNPGTISATEKRNDRNGRR